MKALNKSQIEAVVEEVQERLSTLSTPSVLPHRALKEWEDLKPALVKRFDMEDENEVLSNKIDDLKEELREYDYSLHRDIKSLHGEINDMIDNLTNFEPIKVKDIDWQGISSRVKKRNEMNRTMEKLEEEHEKQTSVWEEFEDEVRDRVREFENKYELDVEYRYLERDKGEEPSVKYRVKDFKDKIRRQIAILSIDKKGPLTADDLIDTIVNKFLITG
jgi:hypothetical protein